MPEHQQIQQSKKPDTIFKKQATPVFQTPVSNPYSIIQRAKINPKSLTHADIMQLQRTIGNRAVGRLLSGIGNSSTAQQAAVQRQEIPEEEEPLQGKFENKPEIACPSCFAAPIVQRQEIPEEEEPLQGKFERVTDSSGSLLRKVDPTTTVNGVPVNDDPSLEHEADVMGAKAAQFVPAPGEDKPLQGKFGEWVVQKAEKAANNTGLPDNLKAGIENLSGMSMDGVKVHYNSGTPAQLNALAYAQGSDIHIAPGQERHLPHEAWHVVQQKQGLVKPTMVAQLAHYTSVGVPDPDDPECMTDDNFNVIKGMLHQPTPHSDVNKAVKNKTNIDVILWRGTSRASVAAIKQANSAGGAAVQEDVAPPRYDERQKQIAIGGILPEYTSDTNIEGFSRGHWLVVVRINTRYLGKASGKQAESGWACYPSAPVEVLDTVDRTIGKKEVFGPNGS